MKKTVITMLAVAMIVFASPAFAQTDVLVVDGTSVGLTPASPFYFMERLFEGVGTFFTFGNSAKAERFLKLAEERLAEARALAEDGDERAQVAVERYEEQIRKAQQRNESDLEFISRLTDATTKHLVVLDEVLEKVPEQARASIQAAKERSITGQIEALRGIAEQDPEVAVDIFARAAEGRLNAANARAGGFIKIGSIEGESVDTNTDNDSDGDGLDDGVEEALEDFERYAEFGKEISTLAQGLQTGTTTVEQLVERATSHHRDILLDLQSKAPPQAQDSIQRALDKSTPQLMDRVAPVQTGRPVEPAQQQRNIPENSVERANSGSQIEEVEIEENEVENGTEAGAGAGGPPPGIPAPVPRAY